MLSKPLKYICKVHEHYTAKTLNILLITNYVFFSSPIINGYQLYIPITIIA